MKEELIKIQIQEFPDSRIVTDDEATWWPMEDYSGGPNINLNGSSRSVQYVTRMLDIFTLRVRQYEWILFCLNNFPDRIFYECGYDNKKEVYKWRGCRFGTSPGDYVSGYPRGRLL